MDKAGRLSIKEFSDITELNESTLRYYDKVGLLSPAFRGENRYRYYASIQIITANFIKVLSMLGVKLSAITSLSKNRTPQAMLALLEQQQNILNTRLLEIQTAYSVIHAYHNNIQTGISANEDEICVQELGEARFSLGQVNDFAAHNTFYKPFMDFCHTACEQKINLYYPIGGYHNSIDDFFDAPSRPNRFFSQDSLGNHQRAAGKYLIVYVRGYYGEFGDLAPGIVAYAKANNFSFYGPVYVSYVLDEVSIVNHTQYLAQVVVGVTKNGQAAGRHAG